MLDTKEIEGSVNCKYVSFPEFSTKYLNAMKKKKTECKHESDWLVYTSFPPCYKCKKCWEYYS